MHSVLTFLNPNFIRFLLVILSMIAIYFDVENCILLIIVIIDMIASLD